MGRAVVVHVGRPVAHVSKFEANVWPVALSGIGGCCATGCTETRTDHSTDGATNGSADYATGDSATCATRSLIGHVGVLSTVIAITARGVSLKAHIRPVVFGGIGHRRATGCTEACAYDRADWTTNGSAYYATCYCATRTSGGLVGRVVIAVAVVINYRSVAIRDVFGSVTDCFARARANGSAYCSACGNTDRAADCTQGPTDYSACCATGTRTYDIATFARVCCGCHASARRATNGRADTCANGAAYHAADDPTGNSAARATYGLTRHTTLISGRAVAIVGVVIHRGVVLNVTRAVVVEDVTRHTFLAVGHAGC